MKSGADVVGGAGTDVEVAADDVGSATGSPTTLGTGGDAGDTTGRRPVSEK